MVNKIMKTTGGALLLALFAVLPLLTGCGDKAIGADGTVIATY